MSVGTIRTLGQIVGELPDNTSRAIAPLDVRELALSTWGAVMDRDPTMNDDSANTSGAGFFDDGSRWTNRANKSYWVCFGGTPFAAVWWQVRFVQDGPSTDALNVRIMAGPGEIDAMRVGPFDASAVFADNEVGLANIADAQHLAPGMTFEADAGFPGTTIISTVDYTLGILTVSETSTGTGPITFTSRPFGYTWIQQAYDPETGYSYDKPGGEHGELDTAPAIAENFVGGQANLLCQIRFRGIISGLPCWTFRSLHLEGVGTVDTIQGSPDYWIVAGSAPSFSVVGGDNVSVVQAPTGTFTVSVTSFPASAITGTLPQSQVGAGYPASIIGAGTFPINVYLNPLYLLSGPMAAGVTIAYSQITGAPSPGPKQSVIHLAGVATPVARTVIWDTGLGTFAWLVSRILYNAGPNPFAVWVTFYDLFGNSSAIGPFTINPGTYDVINAQFWQTIAGLTRAIGRYVYEVGRNGQGPSTFDFDGQALGG